MGLIHWTILIMLLLIPVSGWGQSPVESKRAPVKQTAKNQKDLLSYLRDPDTLLERISRLPPDEIEALVGDMESFDIEVLVERLKKLEDVKKESLISPASF